MNRFHCIGAKHDSIDDGGQPKMCVGVVAGGEAHHPIDLARAAFGKNVVVDDHAAFGITDHIDFFGSCFLEHFVDNGGELSARLVQVRHSGLPFSIDFPVFLAEYAMAGELKSVDDVFHLPRRAASPMGKADGIGAQGRRDRGARPTG